MKLIVLFEVESARTGWLAGLGVAVPPFAVPRVVAGFPYDDAAWGHLDWSSPDTLRPPWTDWRAGNGEDTSMGEVRPSGTGELKGTENIGQAFLAVETHNAVAAGRSSGC